MRYINGYHVPAPPPKDSLSIAELKPLGDCGIEIHGEHVTMEIRIGSYDRGIYLGETNDPLLRNVTPEVVVEDGSYVLVFPFKKGAC